MSNGSLNFGPDLININTRVYNTFGEPAEGVVVFEENKPTNASIVLNDGTLTLNNVDFNAVLIFTYFETVIAKTSASSIGDILEVNTALELEEVVIGDKPKSNLAYKILGALGIIGIGYSVFGDEAKKVNL